MGFLFAPRDVCDVLFLGQRSSTRTGPTWFTGQNADVRNHDTSMLHPSAYKPCAAGKPYRDPRNLATTVVVAILRRLFGSTCFRGREAVWHSLFGVNKESLRYSRVYNSRRSLLTGVSSCPNASKRFYARRRDGSVPVTSRAIYLIKSSFGKNHTTAVRTFLTVGAGAPG